MTDDKIANRHNCIAMGASMRTLISLLVAAAFAAATKEKKQKQSTEAEEIAKQHDNTRRALRDALPLVLPSWSLPFYFGMNLDQTKDQKKKN
jgi:hypothetical protein